MRPLLVQFEDEYINLSRALTWRLWQAADGNVILTVEWDSTEKDFVCPCNDLEKMRVMLDYTLNRQMGG